MSVPAKFRGVTLPLAAPVTFSYTAPMTIENQAVPQNISERRYSFATLSFAFLIIVILTVPLVIVVGGMTNIMLAVTAIYKFYDMELPHMTVISVTLSNAIASYWYLCLGLIVLLIPLALWLLSKLSIRSLTLIFVFSLGVIVGAIAVFVPFFAHLRPFLTIMWDLAP